MHVDNAAFRAIRAATPGPYTFILPATPEVPRRLLHPRKRTVGVRIPDHTVVHALLDLLGEPLLSSTLILPGETEPRTLGWDIKEELDHAVDLVIEAGETPAEPTTVIDWSDGAPEVLRYGAGDAEPVRRLRRQPGRAAWRRAEPVADRQAEQARGVPDAEGDRVVREAGDHRLGQAVAVAARSRPGGRSPTSTKTASMISGGSTPTVKKSSGRTSSATARQTPTKARSKKRPTRPPMPTSRATTVRVSARPRATIWRPGS